MSELLVGIIHIEHYGNSCYGPFSSKEEAIQRLILKLRGTMDGYELVFTEEMRKQLVEGLSTNDAFVSIKVDDKVSSVTSFDVEIRPLW